MTDNASNMKKAFEVRFPDQEQDDEELDEDEAELGDLSEEEEGEIQTALQTNSRHRVSCFAHTLQLVIGDGLQNMRVIGKAMAKVSKMSTLLHRSTVFKER